MQPLGISVRSGVSGRRIRWIVGASARFGMPPAKLGLVYSATELRPFVDLIGTARTKWVFFSGRLIDAPKALQIGLADEVLPDDELDRYRPMIARVSQDDVLAAARQHIRPDDMSIVVVGDASQVEAPLRDAGLGELTVVPADASPG